MVPEKKYTKPSSIADLAARLAGFGYWPVPIPAGSKGPTIAGWDTLRITPGSAPEYFSDAALVGCLHVNLGCFDIDVTDEALAAEIVAEGFKRFPRALERIGKPPKSAIVFRLDAPGYKVRNTEKHSRTTTDGEVFEAQVEVRTLTRQMVVYGHHPETKKPYTWPRGELWETPRDSLPDITEADAQAFRDWCNNRIRAWAGVTEKPTARVYDLGEFRPATGDDKPPEAEFLEALSYIPATVSHNAGWLDGLMAIHDFYGGSMRGLEVAKNWSSMDARFDPHEVEMKWRSFEAGKGISYRAVFHHAQQNGANLSDIARKYRGKPQGDDLAADFKQSKPARLDVTTSPEAASEDGTDWQDSLIRNSRGRVLWNVHNAMAIMQHDESLRGRFAFDEFRQVKMLTQPLPYTAERSDRFSGREVRDSDITKLVSYFNRIGFPDATKNVAHDVAEAVSEMSTFHPVRNYLGGLPAWDGVKRLDTWLEDYCGCDPEGDEGRLYVREVARRWLISAVARVMRPGCKADGVLILEGRQGAMKSTTLRILAGGDWFGDSLPSLHTKDASDYLRGKWIIEMAELSNMNKAEVEIVKAFIAREEERFRPAYGRSEITYKRQCVFAGTTNKTDYLRDETGNRRFWPIKVGSLCDVTSLQRDRDMLWAEAFAAFNAHEIWWLSGDAAKVAEGQQAERVSQDAWEGDIMQFVVGKSEVSCSQIASSVLNIEVGRIDRMVTNRISAILTGNGWTRKGTFTHGAEKGRARFVLAED